MNRVIAFYSYVFINRVDDGILIFNTINKSILVVDSKRIYNLFANIELNDTSKYYIEFSDELFEDDIFNSFLNELEEKNMGELLSVNINYIPISFSPLISVGKHGYKVVYELLNSGVNDKNYRKEKSNVLGRKMLNNLKEISVYTNSTSSQYIRYANCHKFYYFPIIGKNECVNLSSLLNFIDYNYQYKIRINFIIGDFSDDIIKNINTFISYSNTRFDIFIYTLYSNIDSVTRINISSEKILLWVLPFSDLEITSSYKFIGIFSNDSELDYYEKNDHYFLYYYPCFTGNNEEYCFDKLKFNLEDILEQDLGETDIFSRKLINSNFYGKIFILPNGEIHTNLNNNSLGNINFDNLKELILKEMTDAKNWFLTRNNVSPCSNCKFNILCPPIGYIELHMGRFNFCDFE